MEAVTALKLQGQRDQKLPSKLAILLQHRYTKTNLYFAGLKGEDRIIAEVLKCCKDLELHLCILTKHQIGAPHGDDGFDSDGSRLSIQHDNYRHQRRYDNDDKDIDDDDANNVQHSMEEVQS